MNRLLAIALALALPAAPVRAAGPAITQVAHHFDIDRTTRVRCAADGALFLGCAGEVVRGAVVETLAPGVRVSGTAVEPMLALGPVGDALPEPRAARLAERRWRALPHRDRMMFRPGLRSPDVAGGAASGEDELFWFGAAATGITVRSAGQAAGGFDAAAQDEMSGGVGGGPPAARPALRARSGQWLDLATGYHVFDADVAPDGGIWAITDQGLVRVPRAPGQAVQRVQVRAFRPGNALDGAFAHDNMLHVYGPRGLYNMIPIGAAPLWMPLTEAPVRDAKSTPLGVGALSGPQVWLYPGHKPLSQRMPSALWWFGWTSKRKVYLASAQALYAWEPTRLDPAMDVFFGAPPIALACEQDLIVLAHGGPEGWVWIGRETGQKIGPSLRGTRVDLTARCFRIEPGRILAGTDEGLASIEDERVHWYFRQPGLRVDAIARVPGGLYVLATSAGLLVLDGPMVVARHPLGGGVGARVTALVPFGGDLYAATHGQGLYRFKVTGEGGARGR